MSAAATDAQSESELQPRANALFLDTNILMYAAGVPHPLRDPCRASLRRAVALHIPLVANAEVLQEILYRYFSINRRDTAESVYGSAIDLCDEILAVTENDTARALELLLADVRMSPRDAIHVATMQSAGLRRILSTDRDFDAVAGVERVDPAAFARG